MPNIDSPDENYTHEERREHFLKTLAVGLGRFNMDSCGSHEADGAVATYKKLIEEKEIAYDGVMHPRPDSILWIYGDRMGRYLVYPFARKKAIHLAFGFLAREAGQAEKVTLKNPVVWTVQNRPVIETTFQLRACLAASGFSYWDSRVRKTAFTRMKDEFTFNSVLAKLIFSGDIGDAVAYTAAIKQRLCLL